MAHAGATVRGENKGPRRGLEEGQFEGKSKQSFNSIDANKTNRTASLTSFSIELLNFI